MRPYVEAPAGVTADGPGDPDRIADAILDSVDVSPAHLGSDACQSVHAAPTGRLEELEAAKDLAFSTDFADSRTTEWVS